MHGPAACRCHSGQVADKKPRILHNNKDLIWSLIPLLLACLVIAAVAGQCSLHVGGPKEGVIPTVDAPASWNADAATLDFPIRSPQVPDGWTPNSASRKAVTGADGAQESTVGFITTKGNYLAVTQSSATEDQLVKFVADGARSATDAQQIAGVTWVVYGEEGVEALWVADFRDVRVLITGAGTSDEFLELATAVVNAKVLP